MGSKIGLGSSNPGDVIGEAPPNTCLSFEAQAGTTLNNKEFRLLGRHVN